VTRFKPTETWIASGKDAAIASTASRNDRIRLARGCSVTASMGGISGLIEGNPEQLLTQFCGVAATLAGPAGESFSKRQRSCR
jgi:hypothetical protein